LDLAVRAAWRGLQANDVDLPQTLLLLGTGVGLLPERLHRPTSVALEKIEGVPAPWRGARLWSGTLGGHRVWICEDPAGEPRGAPIGDAWERAFPVWLAAVAGARLLVHASAGSALAGESGKAALGVGSFALVSDHINLSGATPLLGLGESTLGPLFPDVSRLHHGGLRRAARKRAAKAGIGAADAVVACTAGPSVETAAEKRFYSRAGADVAVQGLAAPLLAAAHAGLSALAIVAIADRGAGPTRLRDVVAAAGAAEAALEDLVLALVPDLDAAYAEVEARS
jgi:purine-nucleoside phosphorylase